MEINKEQKYIVRAVQAGVFYGNIKEKNGDEVTMTNVRCLWYWDGAASLCQLAVEGVKRPGNCKFTVTVPELTILNACEIIPCSNEAVNNIDAVSVWKR